MPAIASSFNSVKLPSALVMEARQTAVAMRRSTAGQIEYWAMLGKAVEDGGLTAREASVALMPARQASSAQTLLDDIDSRFTKADASGSLARRMRDIVVANQSPTFHTEHRLAA
jgi:hypothetical protein